MSRRPIAAALALLLCCGALPLPAQTVADRDLYQKSLKVARQAVVQYGRYDNAQELERVNRIGFELAQQSRFSKFPFTFELVDLPVPNAFALPGGHIFVTRGMLDLGLSNDMLAALLGHEIAHVTLAHHARMQRKATLMTVLSQVLIAGVLLGADRSRDNSSNAPYDPRLGPDQGQSGDLIQGAAAASLVVSELLLRSYSREHEDESDDEGQRLAAAAGYDPAGARQLWDLMKRRFPQSREYGYWRTHPFPEERQRAAEVRAGLLKIADVKKPADDFRQRTQAALVNYLEREKPGPEEVLFLKDAVVATWPTGRSSETIRLEKLRQARDQELAKPLLSRDYGLVLRAYREARDTVKGLAPGSELLPTLDAEIADLEGKVDELYPKAVEVLGGGVYETMFLVAFLSNFPEAPEVPDVALALGDAYSRLGDPTQAVTQYLRSWEAAPASGPGKRAATGLRLLAPSLTQLAALQKLADQERDPELERLAEARLAQISKSYEDLSNGAEYLRLFPEGGQVTTVIDRLNVLADDLYGEVVLYQGVGDNVKAVERINRILTYAPLSPAAERLRDRAVLATT